MSLSPPVFVTGQATGGFAVLLSVCEMSERDEIPVCNEFPKNKTETQGGVVPGKQKFQDESVPAEKNTQQLLVLYAIQYSSIYFRQRPL